MSTMTQSTEIPSIAGKIWLCGAINRSHYEVDRGCKCERTICTDLILPIREEKDAICRIYRDLYEIDPSRSISDDTDWTGAVIKSCCHLSALLDLSLRLAAKNAVPVAVATSESMDRLRSWARGRCLSASRSGIYQQTDGASKTCRRVNGEPSIN
ncbi:hypothetical protein [Allorhodopirellula heiligendammensis]|uniref:Uncharacterized protein n=1 Tax=Allorhodopirellula heiligendammensis TaxID=2714739 RepID=A0A5C6BE73_9BACT|nr:hypothetical protein [Allorhodopirellula heiligendammensis]TWU10270.1 hypothetical protein Poly21_52410 [Allorhodopirellula heiligendammensis]